MNLFEGVAPGVGSRRPLAGPGQRVYHCQRCLVEYAAPYDDASCWSCGLSDMVINQAEAVSQELRIAREGPR